MYDSRICFLCSFQEAKVEHEIQPRRILFQERVSTLIVGLLTIIRMKTCKTLYARTSKKYLLVGLPLLVLIAMYSSSSKRIAVGLQNKPCKIHELDPWDKSLKEYLRTPRPIKCPEQYSLFYVGYDGVLQLNQSEMSYYKLTSLKCVYHKIRRANNDFNIEIDDAVGFTAPVFVANRVFRVVCKTAELGTVYDFVHVNIAWNESNSREAEIGQESPDDFSIIYFGLDSASRSHAIRKLQKSYKYLTESLGAYDFRGFMKVGLNSYPNLVPLLTGTEHSRYRMENILRTHLDKMPFIWTEPLMRKYATLHSEDRPDISTFNYLNSGFKIRPVDYYYREYGLAMDQLEPTVMKPLGQSTRTCYGNKQHFLLQIDYLKRFITKYTGRLKFAFLWNNQIGHEDFISLGRGDEPLFEYLQWMKLSGHLEKCILIVGSDHGFRLGGASTTYVGRLENNMPFLVVYVPEILKKRFPWLHENLKHNTETLVSAYDIHESMMTVLNKNYANTENSAVYFQKAPRSIFKKIPEARSCADAGIPEQYCTCSDATSVNTSDTVVAMAASFVVKHINNLLNEYKSLCRPLFLHNITEAKAMYIAEGDSDNSHIDRDPGFFKRLFGAKADNSGRYILMLYTGPNMGLIEGMVDFERFPADGPENKLTVIGDPVRVNMYGNQSHCIQDATLRQYCLCNDIKV